MASITPSEVMDQIFILLPLSTVQECMLVCKSWYLTAVRVQYSSVALTETNVDQFVHTLANRYTNQPYSNSIAVLVRHLYLNFKLNMALPSEGDISILMDSLTNLKSIHMQSLSDAGTISYLQRMQSNRIEEIKLEGDDRYSKEIKKLHFMTAYRHRNTITHLHLNYLQASYTMNNKTGNYLNFLPDFKNLTHLSIFNDLYTGDRYMVIYTVLDMCPKLKSFMLKSIRYFPDASQPKLMSLMEKDLLLNNSNATSMQQKNVKLKSLVFDIHELDEVYMKYIVLYTRVDSFKLKMVDINFYDWLINRQDIISEFAYYLSHVKDLEIIAYMPEFIGRGGRRSSATDLHEHLSFAAVTNYRVNKHWSFINNIVIGASTTRRLNCHVYFSVSGYKDEQKFELKVIEDKSMVLTYNTIPEHSRSFITSLLQRNDTIGGGPSIIDSLELNDDAVRFTLAHSLEALEFALKNCPKLKFIIVHRAKLCYRMEAIPYPFNIHFNDNEIESGKGKEYIDTHKVYSNSDNESTINHISIRNAGLCQELIQLLCTYLPHTKVLLLKHCTLSDEMVLDLRGIYHLHYLELDTTYLMGEIGVFDVIFLTINMSNNDKIVTYISRDNKKFMPTTLQYMELYQTRVLREHVKTLSFTICCNTIDTVAIITNNSMEKKILKPGIDIPTTSIIM